MNLDNRNEYDKLIERFREDLKRPLAERDYTEEELIAIFDRSADNLDDYLRVEALLLGIRLFPDSVALRERRAVMYEAFGEDVADKFYADNIDMDSTLIHILRLGHFKGSKEQAERIIAQFIESYELKEDEEIIQFIHIFNKLDVCYWLFENLEKVENKCANKSLFYFEAAIAAEMDGDNTSGIKVLEKLTELEPFSSEYWTMLASLYEREGRNDEAANAVDYALAINPEFIEALKIKIQICPKLDDNHTAIIEKYCAASPELMAFAIENKLTAASIFNLQQLYDNGFTNADDWQQLAAVAFDCNDPATMEIIIRTYMDKSGMKLGCGSMYTHALFRAKLYDVVLQGSELVAEMNGEDEVYKTGALILLSALRVGATNQAQEMAVGMYNSSLLFDHVHTSNVLRFGFRSFLNDVMKRLKSKKPTDWETYDPLGFDA